MKFELIFICYNLVSWKLCHLLKKGVCTARSLREKVDYMLLVKRILDIKLDKDSFLYFFYRKECSE